MASPDLDTLSRDEPAAKAAAPIGVVGMARWAWRQLTSMRTALILLFLLAVAAVPGSIVPQERVSPFEVDQFTSRNPDLAAWFEWFGLFDVYTSVWFSAIYLLLMVSLVGCFVPRTRVYWRSLRAPLPRTPRNLNRLPGYRQWTDERSAAQVLDAATAQLRRRHFKVGPADGSISAESGRAREAGNLLFHMSVIVVLIGVATGALFGYRGGAAVVVGQGFANVATQYDILQPGAMFSPRDDLPPFSLTVESFDVQFETGSTQQGAPRDFDAQVTYSESPGAPTASYDLDVNEPLRIAGTSIHLVGHGYAPRVTVRDGDGEVAFSGPVVFLPQDASMTSAGVIKVPDALPTGLGFEGFFLPTLEFDPDLGPISTFPDALSPALVLLAYGGDLGLDSGEPQSVYSLDTDELEPLQREDGQPARLLVRPGETVELPGGAGSITFDGLDRWVQLQISRTPATWVALGGVVAAIIGLLGSLFIRPRRRWVRATEIDGHTLVEIAGLDRVDGGDLDAELDELMVALEKESP